MNNLEGLLARNIDVALKDYARHSSYNNYIYDDVSERFVKRLAHDASDSKAALREMLRVSPAWDEELQAVVINGTRTHNPDYNRINSLCSQIFGDWIDKNIFSKWDLFTKAMKYFTRPNISGDDLEDVIRAMNEMATGAYRARRKKSRIFKAICDSLGVTDDSVGSKFQKLVAQIADEMSSKKIDFKLFLSINPAHFLTMSNPKQDERGETLTSCHSLNNLEYKYNNGCVGYARDAVTMIAFTVANPDNAELLNNRKTTRQLFMYKPNNGVLLQSRLYNTSGGTYGA